MAGESEIDRMIVRLVGDNAQYVQSLKEAEGVTNHYGQTVEGLREENGKYIKSAKGAELGTDRASRASKEASRVMARAKQITKSVETSTEAYGRELKELSRLHKAGAISQATHARATAKATKIYKSSETAIGRLGGRLKSMGSRMALMSATLTGAGVAAIKTGLDFNGSMNKIVGLVGLSQETVAGFKKEVLAMSGEVGKGPKELADALFFVTSAGFRGAEAIDVLRESAKASAAGLGSTESVADAVTSAVNSYGKESLSAKRATEILTASVRAGKAEAAAFGPVLGRVLPAAQELGVSFDQTAGSIAFLTKSTGDAAQSATGMAGIFNTLMKPSEQARKALKNTGTSFEELKESVKSKGLLPSLVALRKRLDDAGIPLSRVFSETQALNAVLLMTGPAASDAAEVIKSVGDSAGIVDEAFKATSDTAGGRLRKAMAKLKVSLVLMGDTLAPIVEKFSEFLSSVSEWFNGLSKETKEYIAVTLSLVAVMGPLLILLGSMVTAIASLSKVMVIFKASTYAAASSTLAFKAGVIALAIYLAVKLGVALAQTNKHMREYNKQTKIAAKLNTKLVGNTEKKFQKQIKDLNAISDAEKRVVESRKALETSEKNISGVSSKIKGQTAEVEKLEEAYMGLNDLLGNKILVDARTDLAQFEAQKERLEQHRDDLQEVIDQSEVEIGVELKLKIQEEVDQEAEKATKKATEEATKLAKQAAELEASQAKELSKLDAFKKRAENLIGTLESPVDKLKKEQAEIIALRRNNLLTLEQFTELMESNKKKIEEASSVEVKFGVKGLDAVNSGGAEAFNRIQDYLALRPEAEKGFDIPDPVRDLRQKGDLLFEIPKEVDLEKLENAKEFELEGFGKRLPQEVLIKSKSDDEDWLEKINTNLVSLVDKEEEDADTITLESGGLR